MNPNPYINEDLQALAESVRRFADEKIKPGFLEREKRASLTAPCCARWAIWVSSAPKSPKNSEAWAWAVWPQA